jgi:lipoprotein-releasing system ATP-binding protein
MDGISPSEQGPATMVTGLRPADAFRHQTSNQDQFAFRVEGLRKQYRTGAAALDLFTDLSFNVPRGEMLGIVGESGAGKSTLLHLLGALDVPTAGSITCNGRDLARMTPKAAAEFRNRELGYVWQFHYLLPEFTAAENVAMPLLARGESRTKALSEARERLDEVELAARADHRPGELSGGEQQRVAIARSLVTKPKVLLADEPTGDLDNRTAEVVFTLIERLHAQHGLTSVIATHNHGFARRCGRVLRLAHGSIKEVSPQEFES